MTRFLPWVAGGIAVLSTAIVMSDTLPVNVQPGVNMSDANFDAAQTRSPIPYSGVRIVDENGAPAPEAQVYSDADGSGTVAQAKSSLSGVEQYLNGNGFTSQNNEEIGALKVSREPREPGSSGGSVRDSRRVYQNSVGGTQSYARAVGSATAYGTVCPKLPNPLKVAGRAACEDPPPRRTPTPVPTTPAPTTGGGKFDFNKSWSKLYGSSSFNVGLSAAFNYVSCIAECSGREGHTYAHVDGNAEARGTMLSYNFQVVRGDARYDSSSRDGKKGDIGVTVVGYKVWSHSLTSDFSTSNSKPWDLTVFSGSFPLGWVNITYKGGIRGSIGYTLSAGFDLSPTTTVAVRGSIAPNAAVKGFIEGGVSLWLLGGGVGGDLTLIQDTLTASTTVSTNVGSRYVTLDTSLTNTLNSLSGRIYAFAWAKYISWSWSRGFYTKKKTWDWTLINWAGITDNSTIWSQNQGFSI